jgi:hypothetical protein
MPKQQGYEYLQECLGPLERSHSSFAQPPPAMENLATGYQQRGDRFEPVAYQYLNIGPAAVMSSTVTDLAPAPWGLLAANRPL